MKEEEEVVWDKKDRFPIIIGKYIDKKKLKLEEDVPYLMEQTLRRIYAGIVKRLMRDKKIHWKRMFKKSELMGEIPPRDHEQMIVQIFEQEGDRLRQEVDWEDPE